MLRIEAGGNVDPRIAVVAAGFQQQHAGPGIGAQAIGEHAAGRAGADDDEVVFSAGGHGALSLPVGRSGAVKPMEGEIGQPTGERDNAMGR
jgi:hypothetical protein